LTAVPEGHPAEMASSLPAAAVRRLRGLPRVAQRTLRRRQPVLAAELTWAWKRRQGDPVTRLVDDLVRPGQHVLDIGANWGLVTARLARLVGPAGRVDAFEPHPGHVATLEAVAARMPSVEVHLTALSDRQGSAELAIPVHDGERLTALAHLDGRGSGPGVPEERVQVPLTTLDDALAGDRAPVDLIKCDVEGHELEVLRGAEATLRRDHPALVLEIEERHRPGGGVAEVFAQLRALGYEGRAARADGLVGLEHFDVQRDQLDHLPDGELVAHEMPPGYVNTFLFTAMA
jgi:FkbM family methyltransferase